MSAWSACQRGEHSPHEHQDRDGMQGGLDAEMVIIVQSLMMLGLME